ncbi:MAG: DsbA family protein [Rhodobacteraceae bacterium]|jgi:protein-disulfide isomerase|nr:DsbA family protein [Paracoccaceae bacterium]
MTFSFKAFLPAVALALGLGSAAIAQETAEAALPPVSYMAIGPADAKVTIVEYASFTCPHCASFHAAVFKDLKKDYIDTGKVRFEFREVYFDRYGLWAAMMARCGGEVRYFGIVDILYTTQQEWAATDDAVAVVDSLKRIGRTAGMEDATLDACMTDGAMAEALVAQYQENATRDGVEGTPTLLINGEKHSNMSYADLKAIIDPLLAE